MRVKEEHGILNDSSKSPRSFIISFTERREEEVFQEIEKNVNPSTPMLSPLLIIIDM